MSEHRLGSYVLESLLGRGSGSEVWRARREGRAVALKVLLSTDQAEIARFKREAKAVSSVSHPGIVQVYDVGEAGGRPYIEMELVEGQTLAYRRLQAEEAARIVREAAAALGAAHAVGILHRDVKPKNLMLDGAGRVRVLDFGLARQPGGGTTLTKGMMIGTPSYMSPEQARADTRAIDARTDVWGLGATLYDLLAGRPPFVGDDDMVVAMQVCDDDPPAVRSLAPEVPAPLEGIVMKCLEKRPDARYPSTQALADDLGRFLEGRAVEAGPPRPRRRRTLMWVLIAIAAALAALGAGAVVAAVGG